MKQGLIDIKNQSHDRKRKSHKNNPLTCNLFSRKRKRRKAFKPCRNADFDGVKTN